MRLVCNLAIAVGARDIVVASRCTRIKRQDVFLALYPRSGNTWLRTMLTNLAVGRVSEFDDLRRVVPEIEWLTTKHQPYFGGGRGRLVKTHEPWRKAFRRVVYVVRDPRDVAVSAYRYMQRSNKVDGELSDFISQFCRGTVNNYGPWQAHVHSFMQAFDGRAEDFLLLRYENLLSNLVYSLGWIAEFIGLDTTESDRAQAVELSSMKQMRNLESNKSDDKARAADADGVVNTSIIRSGGKETWRDRLNADDVQRIESTMGEVMAGLGYELVT